MCARNACFLPIGSICQNSLLSPLGVVFLEPLAWPEERRAGAPPALPLRPASCEGHGPQPGVPGKAQEQMPPLPLGLLLALGSAWWLLHAVPCPSA